MAATDVIDPRNEERDLLQKAQAGQREPSMVALCKLLELRLLRYQMRMLDCPYDEFPALQAEAKVTAKLIKELKPKQN